MTAEHELTALVDPRCYPHAPHAVRIVQTHLSVVCLAGALVYKLKKAITLPFVDFAPLAARRQACRDEVRLNRRLCPDTYLGTASLRRAPDGQLRFTPLGDDDHPDDLDVAVVMRCLPQERMLDELLRHHAVTAAELATLAQRIAAFHAASEPVPTGEALATADQLADFAAANFRELRALPHGLPRTLLRSLEHASAADFASLLPTLRERARTGHVVDGHGDLHARNVCMTSPPTVYDCIEFLSAFRIGDVATEIAFLVMDLRYRRAKALADAFVAAYVAARGDTELPALLPILCGYRAMVRAKVAAFAAAEPELSATEHAAAVRSIQHHAHLAAVFAAERRGPWWLVVFGPPASGKSRLSARLHELAEWPHFATDRIRKELAGLAATERARPEHYTAAFSARTYGELFARATAASRAGERVVLLDGNFATPPLREQARNHAAHAGVHLLFVHVHVDAATAIARAAARAHDPTEASDADAEVTASRHASFVLPGPEVRLCVHADGRRPSGELVPGVLEAMLSAHAPPDADPRVAAG